MRQLFGAVGLLAASAFVAAVGPTPVAASCAPPPPLEEAIGKGEIVFVGTVTRLENENRWATVAVEEVWRGPDLTSVVEVRGGTEPGTFTSVDRMYELDVRYLFVTYAEGGRLADNACSATRPWEDGLSSFRPEDVRTPAAREPDATETTAFDPVPILVPLVAVAAVGIILFGGLVAARRRTG